MPSLAEIVRHSLNQTVAPAVEPVSLVEAKRNLRITFAESDDEVLSLIKQAREQVEIDTELQLLNATWELTLDFFPAEIELRKPPVSSITSVAYSDVNGDEQTLLSTRYKLDDKSKPARLVPVFNDSWPTTRGEINAVAVTFVAGYGAAASAVPELAKRAMHLLISHWYANREAVVIGTISSQLPLAYKSIIQSLKWGGYQ